MFSNAKITDSSNFYLYSENIPKEADKRLEIPDKNLN